MGFDDAGLGQHLEDLGEECLGHLAGTGDDLQLDRRVAAASSQVLESADGVFGLAGDLQHVSVLLNTLEKLLSCKSGVTLT